jgi:MYXO-CTERM domain-containing protein
VVKVNLATMQQVGAVTLDVRGYSYSAVSDGTHAYFGMRTFPGRVVKVGLGLAVVDAPAAVVPPSVSCAPLSPAVGTTITCRVSRGDPGIDILWRAAYNPVFAEAGVTLDASGSGEFSFVVPAAALGEELTVELVEWLGPVSLGVVGGPVPSSVPSGGGPVPVWSLGLLALAGIGLLRRGMRAEV